ncbi:MAG: DNA polymerase IV, partial [Streptococcus sp.]|nr:DNA polymerase IV [Streptococcus sp.]
ALFIIGHMGLFFYTKKGSIISTVDLPTTEIIEPKKERRKSPLRC